MTSYPPPPPPPPPPTGPPGGPTPLKSYTGPRVQNVMETIARGEEAKEELIFNPTTGELETLETTTANQQMTKPVMTKIAKDGFFSRL